MKKSSLFLLGFLAVLLIVVEPRIFWARSTAHAKMSPCECSSLAASRAAAQTEFYVATDGNDSWSGKLAKPNAGRTDGPFRTLRRAQDAIRALKASGLLDKPATVYIRGGQYNVSKPLVFTAEDSGTPEDPITYAAYPGERPVISGGRAITGWKRVTDRKLLKQAGGELWMARVPEVKEGKWYFRELFVDGHRRTRARTPNEGSYFHVDGKEKVQKLGTFNFHPGDIKPEWAAEGNVEVVMLRKWASLRMYIRKVDEATHTVTLSGAPIPFNREANARYWVENTMDALNAPGEWYLNRQHGILYYRPEPGEKMNDVHVIAPVVKELVRFEGSPGDGAVHDIRFCGLTFTYADWSIGPDGYVDLQAAYDIPAAVAGIGARSIEIKKCVFSHLGGYAVDFGGGWRRSFGGRIGSKDDRIIGNDMVDLGAGGVKIGDPRDPNSKGQATNDNVVSDNHIHDIGRVFPAAVGIWVGESSDNTISHNEINNTYYTGISVGWTWGYGPTAARGNKIEFNEIYDIGQGMLSDMGCIYTLGVQPGTVERNNLCHDVSRYQYGGWGLYTDEGSSDILIEDNVVYRTEDGSFHQNYGANNMIRNNIFADGKNFQLRRTRNEAHISFTFEHNIVYWDSGELLGGKWTNNDYRFDHNLYYRTDGQPIRFGKWTFAEWQAHGQDRHSLIANPLFVDPAQGDFSLKPGSPALSIGFKPINLSRVGPQ